MTFATDQLSINIFILLIGLFLLLKGSDWFVEAASFMARKFDVSEIVIGLTLVSIGTSLPELGTNIYASLYNEGDIALGNVVGSNITNIALVLGLAAIMQGKITVPKSLVKRDSLIMLAIFILFYLLALFSFDNTPLILSRVDGFILTILLSSAFLFFLVINFDKAQKISTINKYCPISYITNFNYDYIKERTESYEELHLFMKNLNSETTILTTHKIFPYVKDMNTEFFFPRAAEYNAEYIIIDKEEEQKDYDGVPLQELSEKITSQNYALILKNKNYLIYKKAE